MKEATIPVRVDRDVNEMIEKIQREDERKRDVIRRALEGYLTKLREESETERVGPDKLLSKFRRNTESPSTLKVVAYALNEAEQREIKEQLKLFNFRFDIIEADMITAVLEDEDADHILEVADQLEKQGWKW